MAERLTKKIGNDLYIGKHCDDCPESIEYCGECSYVQSIKNQLGKLEDILEEFNISSIDELHEFLCWEQEQRKELDKIYNVWEKYGCKTLQEVDDLLQDGCDTICIIEENKKLETDRDTWKRACELACERICYMLDQEMQYHEHEKFNSEEYLKTEIDYFYQQAKKESENNDTNN